MSVLVVVDNSGSMGEEQAALGPGLGVLAEQLTTAGIDWRIGFTTTDYGNSWCQGTGPEAGNLRATSCRSREASFVFQGAQTIDAFDEACANLCPQQWSTIDIGPQPWVESVGGITNLPAELSLTDAMSCLAPQGINGCGFEQPLRAMRATLLREQTPREPAFGFVPDNALLAVVILTDEADCSTNSDWEVIFLPEGNRVFWSDAEAPSPTSAVCWNAGTQCSGGSCSAADLDVNANPVSPEAAEDNAVLIPVAHYADALAEYDHVLFTLIGGVQADGTPVYEPGVDPGFLDEFGIGPGCESAAGSAVPPVRMYELANTMATADAPAAATICQPSFDSVFSSLGDAIIARVQ
ncbi:MAG: hypothetical protein K0V04_38570 [Deltaproteobacteria bacterium]|nr:hypothetical protein [Deltaproteobacteria bacterium]